MDTTLATGLARDVPTGADGTSRTGPLDDPALAHDTNRGHLLGCGLDAPAGARHLPARRGRPDRAPETSSGSTRHEEGNVIVYWPVRVHLRGDNSKITPLRDPFDHFADARDWLADELRRRAAESDWPPTAAQFRRACADIAAGRPARIATSIYKIQQSDSNSPADLRIDPADL